MNETEIFQHYKVLRRDDGSLWELGRGAMGVTYKAFDTNLRCHVALKVVSAQHLHSEVARQRFIREARAAAQLRHRNIATVYHLGVDPQNFFYSMEFIGGETLEALVARVGPLAPQVVLRIAHQTARALAAASRQGLIHRDIKPANLMVLHEDEDGEDQLLVKVIDFGLARSFLHDDLSAPLTITGFVGTPQYASPEQLEEKNLDVRSDIYSLGITLWFLLTGRPPFEGKLTQVMSHHLTKEPPWWQLSDCPAPLRAVLERMLRKDPCQRQQSADELRREIEGCLRSVVSESDPPGTDHASGKECVLKGEGTEHGRLRPPIAIGVGDVIGERFELRRLVGRGSSGKLFEARDLSTETRIVAAKVFHPPWFAAAQDYQRLSAEANKVRAVPHPGLLEIVVVGRWQYAVCLFMEWAGGHTLVDVLRQRGTLSTREALAFLQQAAVVADHACRHDLGWLGFDLRQILILPPGACPTETETNPSPFLSRMPLSGQLKIDAIGRIHCSDEPATWARGVTVTPAPPARPNGPSGGSDSLPESRYLHALAALFYELLSGAPPPGIYAVLPRLCEASNASLRNVLATGCGFGSNVEFFEELARTEGFDPADLDRKSLRPWPATGLPASRDVSPPLPLIAPASVITTPGESPAGRLVAPLSPNEEDGRVPEANPGRQSPRGRLVPRFVMFATFCALSLVYWRGSPGSPGAMPTTAPSKPKVIPLQQEAAAETLPAATKPTPPFDAKPVGNPKAVTGHAPSFALNSPTATLGPLTTSPTTFDPKSDGDWMKPQNHWPPLSASLFAPQSQFSLDESPMSAMVARATLVQTVSKTVSSGDDAKEDDSGNPAASSQQKTNRHTPAHQNTRRKPVPRPNFLQRLFGIKPKSGRRR